MTASYPLMHAPRRMNPMLRMLPSFFDLGLGEEEENWNTMFSPNNMAIFEDDEKVYVHVDMPGMREEHIQITMENGILRIQGERHLHEEKESKEKEHKDKPENAKKKLLQGNINTSYSYRIALPSQIDESKQPKATYKDGVLNMIFEKAKQSIAKRISIQKQ